MKLYHQKRGLWGATARRRAVLLGKYPLLGLLGVGLCLLPQTGHSARPGYCLDDQLRTCAGAPCGGDFSPTLLTAAIADVIYNSNNGCLPDYALSLDGGVSWLPVTDWNPAKTRGRIDFTEENRVVSGQLSLRAEGGGCEPLIDSITLKGKPKLAGALLSRATPVMVGNVLYATSYEIPSAPGNVVGHVKAVRLYESATPAVALSPPVLMWDHPVPLGAVDRSTPAVLTPPGTPAWVYGADTSAAEQASFNLFQQAHATRPTVVLVGARDGKLHVLDAGSFRWGDNPATAAIKENHGYFLTSGSGNELWNFAPADAPSSLDATAALVDVSYQLSASTTEAACVTDGGTLIDGKCMAWRTVLVMGEGDGGDSIFALDVTDPSAYSVLWEKTYSALARSHSLPGAAKVGRLRINGETRWAAFFVSGDNPSDASAPYPSIFVVDLDTGNLLQEIRLDAPVLGADEAPVMGAPNGQAGIVTGQPAVVDSDGNGYLDRLYVATDQGLVYKVNLPDGPLADWVNMGGEVVINWDFIDEDCPTDGGDYQVAADKRWQPVFAAPLAVADNVLTMTGTVDHRVRLFFGTADSPYVAGDATPPYHFFAYVDRGAKGSRRPGDVTLDWFYGLPLGERVVASAEAGVGKIYFGTVTADTDDPCDGDNNGRTYAFDLTAVCGATPTTIINSGDLFSAPLVQDKHLFLRTSTGVVVMGGGNYNNEVRTGGTRRTTPLAWREIE